MARRQPVRAFVPAQKDMVSNMTDSDATARKTVWSPPPSIQSLVSKVDHVEERLDHLETLISQHTDIHVKQQEQEEVEQSRQELVELRRQLDEALEKLQQREQDLQDTRNALDNLSNQTELDRQKIHTLEAEKKELYQLVKDLETKLNERVKKVGRLEKQVADMQRALNHTNNQLAALQHQVQQMQQHMSSMAGGYTPAPVGSQRSTSVASSQSNTNAVGDKRGASPRHHTGTLGLPPIPLPSQQGAGGGGMSARNNTKYYNFPPRN